MRVSTASTGCSGHRAAWAKDVAREAEKMIVTVALRRYKPICSAPVLAG
jgi:hypothetical protein